MRARIGRKLTRSAPPRGWDERLWVPTAELTLNGDVDGCCHGQGRASVPELCVAVASKLHAQAGTQRAAQQRPSILKSAPGSCEAFAAAWAESADNVEKVPAAMDRGATDLARDSNRKYQAAKPTARQRLALDGVAVKRPHAPGKPSACGPWQELSGGFARQRDSKSHPELRCLACVPAATVGLSVENL